MTENLNWIPSLDTTVAFVDVQAEVKRRPHLECARPHHCFACGLLACPISDNMRGFKLRKPLSSEVSELQKAVHEPQAAFANGGDFIWFGALLGTDRLPSDEVSDSEEEFESYKRLRHG